MSLTNHKPEKETFYILDFDRCLGHTEKFQELLEQVIEQDGTIRLDMIRYAHREVRKTGGSFDTAAYVRRTLRDQGVDADATWHRIETAFITAARGQDMFEPHAKELLDILVTRHAHFGILTYGGKDWQKAKLKAAGVLHIPHLITQHKEKGRLIARWQQPDKTFIIPADLAGRTMQVRHVVLIDDKPVSFDDIPREVRGICVAPRATDEQLTALPPNINVVRGMDQATRLLFDNIVDKT